jgi:hypothetical protein
LSIKKEARRNSRPFSKNRMSDFSYSSGDADGGS